MTKFNKNCEHIVKQCLVELLCTHEPFEHDIIDYTINTLINYLIHICGYNPKDVKDFAEKACKLLGKEVNVHLISEDEFNELCNKLEDKSKLLN